MEKEYLLDFVCEILSLINVNLPCLCKLRVELYRNYLYYGYCNVEMTTGVHLFQPVFSYSPSGSAFIYKPDKQLSKTPAGKGYSGVVVIQTGRQFFRKLQKRFQSLVRHKVFISLMFSVLSTNIFTVCAH